MTHGTRKCECGRISSEVFLFISVPTWDAVFKHKVPQLPNTSDAFPLF